MLAIVTLILMASMGGGFLLLPVLIPAHLWAARRSGSLGRVGWSLLPAASLAMVVWAGVYVSIGESKPAIWLVPLLVVVGAFWAIQYVLAKDQRRLPDRFGARPPQAADPDRSAPPVRSWPASTREAPSALAASRSVWQAVARPGLLGTPVDRSVSVLRAIRSSTFLIASQRTI